MYSQMNPVIIEVMEELSVDFKWKEDLGGYVYRAQFENGYGISFVKHDGSYGRESDKWEIAVLKNDDLCYDTEITNDVIGWLSDAEVLEYFILIKHLKPDEYIGKHAKKG